MQTSLVYSGASALIATFQIVDAYRLLRAKGEINQSFATFVFVEYAWAGISLSGLLLAMIEPRWLPISFIAYVVVGILHGVIVAATKKSTTESKFAVRHEVIVAEGLFGLYFFAASLSVLIRNWH